MPSTSVDREIMSLHISVHLFVSPSTWPHLILFLCWSGGRGILTELSLCYSLVLCSISAMHIAQS